MLLAVWREPALAGKVTVINETDCPVIVSIKRYIFGFTNDGSVQAAAKSTDDRENAFLSVGLIGVSLMSGKDEYKGILSKNIVGTWLPGRTFTVKVSMSKDRLDNESYQAVLSEP